MKRFYALVESEPGCAFGIRFPDLPNVFSASDEEEDIIANAIEALEVFAMDDPLPDPMSYDQIMALPEVQKELAEGCYLIQVPFDESSFAGEMAHEYSFSKQTEQTPREVRELLGI